MHAAFLTDRSMSVKIGTVLSEPRVVTGGAVQGSVLGVIDHNVVLNNLDDNILDIYIAKYVDDMALIDIVDNEVQTTVDNTANRPLHTFQPPKTQAAFNQISRKANSKGLKINEDKTQLLSVPSAFYDTRAVLKDNQDREMSSGNALKMLGFNFSNQPTIQPQIDYLIRRASKRYFLLLHYKRSGISKK